MSVLSKLSTFVVFGQSRFTMILHFPYRDPLFSRYAHGSGWEPLRSSWYRQDGVRQGARWTVWATSTRLQL